MEVASGFVHMIYEDKDANINIPLLGVDMYSYNNSKYQLRKNSEVSVYFLTLMYSV